MINLEKGFIEALHGSQRVEFFALELLDKMGVKKGNIELISGYIEASKRSQIQKAGKLVFVNPSIKVNYLTDKVRVLYNLKTPLKTFTVSLGYYMMVKPIEVNGIVSTQIYDEVINVQQARYIEPKLFLKDTLYTEVLGQILTSCKILKVNIVPSTLRLQTDLILDDSKTKVEWFNYLAEQINYNNITVDNSGWFVSGPYKEPSPANVGYIYKADRMSVIVGELNKEVDYWQVPNIFKRVVSHPELGVLSSVYENNNPTDPFSTANRFEIVDFKTVDNIAGQIELDNLTRKAAFEASQVTQNISFNTLIMPNHGIGEVLDLRHPQLNGLFVEEGWKIELKSGSVMQHNAKRLVKLND